MAPEILDNHGASYVSDFYSLGCIMHLMLTGWSPSYSNEIHENI